MSRSFYAENARWLGAGFSFTFTSAFGQTFFISLFAGHIQAAYGLTDGGWGSVYTIATLASAAVLFQLGAVADRVRLDRLALGVIGVYALVALGMAAGGSSVILLCVLVFGLRLGGQGMMSHMALTAMGRWFRAHRGRAVAIAGLGFATGEAVLPAITVAVIDAIGWRMAWVVVAGVLVFGAAPLLTWLLAAGREPRGAAEAAAAAGLGGVHWSRPEVLRHWAFWALLPAVLTPSFIGTVIFFHQVHVSTVKDWDLAVMALGYPVYAGLTVSASLTAGWLADRVGPARLLPVLLVPMGAGITLMGMAGTVSGWFAALGLLGLTQGMLQATWGALWPELYGTRHLGAVRAMTTTAMVFSTAIGPGITGLLIDAGVTLPAQAPVMGLWCLGVSAFLVVVLRGLRAEALRS